MQRRAGDGTSEQRWHPMVESPYHCRRSVTAAKGFVMATVREGNAGVLLVVDVQAGVMREAWDADRIVRNVSLAVDRARAQAVPVIWVQHSDDDLPYGSPDWQWVEELAPRDDEPRIDKHFNSSFEQTALESELARLGATHIALAGAATNWCIRATAYGALDRGYDLTLVSDAHTTGTMELDDGTTIEAASIVGELNAAMTWLAYPGRINGTATAKKLDFATPGGTRRS
jgi:nicotinamidase-related amidase